MPKPSLYHVFKSVIAAGIGVQSNKNRKIDFVTGSLSSYIIVGLIVTILFISVLCLIVSVVVS
ncbi:MAG: DUF2970 domain-containing protein [Methylococcales symbiont of Hymedesmia sp. n. MRB-2018]|nr:MAG: DUF2970 domain-containing protein [Methylococcales symbiont of Hymedesmia sp. n. MRB-2018]KAF3984363.1 MAG: DUF2970 domain-containing protein [Methylococcales symbiont of Hymedesmia sp. n. MRB-2018]